MEGQRAAGIIVAACFGACAVLAIQFPDFLRGTLLPTEPDIISLEGAVRRHYFEAGGSLSPLTALGVPIFAVPAHGMAAIGTWLATVFEGDRVLVAGWLLYAMAFVSGWALCLHRLGQYAVAAIGAPLLILATGPVWSFHAVATVDMASLAFTGWVVVAAARWCASRRPGDAMLIGAILALVFAAGDPFMAPTAAFIAACLCWPRRPAPPALLRGVAVAGTIAAAAIAPLLVETRAFMPLSERAAGLSPHEALSFSTPPARLLELFSQGFALTPDAIVAVNAGSMNGSDFWYPSLTFGVVVIVLGAVGVRAARGQRGTLLVVAGMGLAAFLALGRWNPVAAWLWEHVPPLSLMRFPERLWRYVVVMGVPLVGGGLAVVAARAGRHARSATIAVVLLGLGELLLQTPAPLMDEPPLVPPEFAALQNPARRHDVRISVDRRTNLGAAPVRFDTRIFDLPMLNAPDPTGPPVLKYIPAEAWPTHLAQQWLGVSHVIMPVVDDNAATVAALGLETGVMLGDTGYELRRVTGSGPRVGTLLTRVSPGRPFVHLELGGLPLAAPDGALATVVPHVEFAPFIKGLRDGAFLVDERHHLDGSGVLTAGSSVPTLEQACADHGRAVDLDVAVDLTSIRANVTSRCPALLSVPWRFLAGWRATVNGTPADIVAVNSLTMGVPIEAGDSVVEFHWRTPGRSLAWLSVLAALSVIATLALDRVRRQ